MPKFGELIATDVWEAAARTLSDFSAEELFDLPVVDDHYGNIYATSSGTADTFGSSFEVDDDVGEGKRLLFVSVWCTSGTAADGGEVEFRDAADGGGNLIARVEMPYPSIGSAFTFPVWVALADSSALHVRVKDTTAGAYTYKVGVQIA